MAIRKCRAWFQKASCVSLLLLIFLGQAASGQSTVGLEQLRGIQARIQRVAAENAMATVLVSDGISSGSGVVVSADGLVLTAGHVLATGGNQFKVTLPTGREVSAHPLGKNLNIDAGMMRIDEPGLWPHVELGDSDSLKVGDWSVCLGHPGGYEIGRTPPVRAGKILEFRATQLITDCALIGGDSGGPLFDLDGKLIGIHSSISESIAVNRHVSIRKIRESWDRMLAGESWGTLPDLAEAEEEDDAAPRAGLGISVDFKQSNGKITKVNAGSVAARNGFQVGDVVVQIDNVTIQTPQQIVETISGKSPGDSIRITLERNGQRLQFQLKLDAI